MLSVTEISLLTEDDTDPEALVETSVVVDVDADGESVVDGEPDSDKLRVSDRSEDADTEPEALTSSEEDLLPVTENDGDILTELEMVREELLESSLVGEPVGVTVADNVADAVDDWEPEMDNSLVPEVELLPETLGESS